MATVVTVDIPDGATVTASSVNTPVNAHKTQVNGNLDGDNILIKAGYATKSIAVEAVVAVATGSWGCVLPNKEHILVHASARVSTGVGNDATIDLQKSVNAGGAWTSMFNPAVATVAGAVIPVPISVPLSAAQQVCIGGTWLRLIVAVGAGAPANLTVELTFKVIHGQYDTSV